MARGWPVEAGKIMQAVFDLMETDLCAATVRRTRLGLSPAVSHYIDCDDDAEIAYFSHCLKTARLPCP